MSDALRELGEHIASNLDEAVLNAGVALGELTIEARRDRISEVLSFLRDDRACDFVSLIDICAVDYPNRSERFDVVYHLLSLKQNHRVRVRIRTDETAPVPSVMDVFPAANWFEREAFDMYGVVFSGHPDLRRILTDYALRGILCVRTSR